MGWGRLARVGGLFYYLEYLLRCWDICRRRGQDQDKLIFFISFVVCNLSLWRALDGQHQWPDHHRTALRALDAGYPHH